MQVKAVARLRYVSIPPKKMRLVAGMIKGLPVQKALDLLNFTPKIAAYHLAKTLKSAAANALSIEGTDHLRPETLTVSNIIVDEAPTQKRIRFQAMGRVFRYRKRFLHLTVLLEGVTDEPSADNRPEAKSRKSKKLEAVDAKTKKTKTSGKTANKTAEKMKTKAATVKAKQVTSKKSTSTIRKSTASGKKSR